MSEVQILNGAFREVSRGSGIYKPFVRVSLYVNGAETEPVTALVDTGAFLSLVDLETLAILVGISEDEIKATGEKQSLVGVEKTTDQKEKADDETKTAWGWPVMMRLRTRDGSPDFVAWNAKLYGTKMSIPYRGMLIGQKDCLQGRALIHLNYPNKKAVRHWCIRPGIVR